MSSVVASKAAPETRVVTLQVETDPETRRLFGAAARILGGTIQSTVNTFMRETISRAGLGAGLDSPHSSR